MSAIGPISSPVSVSSLLALGARLWYRKILLGTNPVAYWRVDEPSGTSAVDATGNGHTGAYYNTPTLGVAGLLAGDTDTAVTFAAASNQYMSVPDAVGLRMPGAIALWVKTTQAALAFFVSKCVPSTSGWEIQLNADGTVSVIVHSAGAYTPLNGSVGVHDGNPHFIVAQVDGSNMSLYIDGALDRSGAGVMVAGTTQITFGTRSGIGYSYSGTIDEPAIWNRALTLIEIANLYTAGKG